MKLSLQRALEKVVHARKQLEQDFDQRNVVAALEAIEQALRVVIGEAETEAWQNTPLGTERRP
jgi:hypothetical protein